MYIILYIIYLRNSHSDQKKNIRVSRYIIYYIYQLFCHVSHSPTSTRAANWSPRDTRRPAALWKRHMWSDDAAYYVKRLN